MEWLRELRIAVILKDIDKLDLLTLEMPTLLTLQEKKDALFLLEEALSILGSAREDTKKSLSLLRKNIDFLNATKKPLKSSIDFLT